MALKARKRSCKNKPPPNRPKKLRQWDDGAMVSAMNVVACGNMGINRAALEFGVPQTTLKDRVSGIVVHGTNIGPKPYLCYEEEKELVDFSEMFEDGLRQKKTRGIEACRNSSSEERCNAK